MKPKNLRPRGISHSAFWALVIVLLAAVYFLCAFAPELIGGR